MKVTYEAITSLRMVETKTLIIQSCLCTLLLTTAVFSLIFSDCLTYGANHERVNQKPKNNHDHDDAEAMVKIMIQPTGSATNYVAKL